MKTGYLFIILVVFACACRKSSGYVNNPGISSNLHSSPVGASARDLLSGAKYSSVNIEVQYMRNYVPDPSALEHLRGLLTTIINKPGGINITVKEIPATSTNALSLNDIDAIEKEQRTVFTQGSTLGIYILYTNGIFTNPAALGIAYRNTSIVLFGKKIEENSGSFGQAARAKLVATIAEHEMGHLLGLVNNGTAMQSPHQDVPRGSHCTTPTCLMYYAAESTEVLGSLFTGNIPTFDASCRADMVANGGK